jgi:hypothetical protein
MDWAAFGTFLDGHTGFAIGVAILAVIVILSILHTCDHVVVAHIRAKHYPALEDAPEGTKPPAGKDAKQTETNRNTTP